MNCFRISGVIREAETGRGLEGLAVEIRDADLFADDLLAAATTDAQGGYSVDLPSAQYPVFRERPDLYLVVRLENGRILTTTRDAIHKDVEHDTEINADISKATRIAVGLSKDPSPVSGEYRESFLKTWTFLPDAYPSGSVWTEIENDLQTVSSILELFKKYMGELYLNPDNDAPPFSKLDTLFNLGNLPESIEGHVHGVWMCFRSGDQSEPLSAVGNFLQMLAGTALDAQCPWVGKTFALLSPDQILSLTDGAICAGRKAFFVTNHFRRIEGRIPNHLMFEFFNFWSGLADAPPEERVRYGHRKNGAPMIACQGPSVRPETLRQTLTLSYRWKHLGNKPPMSWLIDEVVEVAEGLCLGQILAATRKLLDPYDPARPPGDYAYRPVGWFGLFSEAWNAEARRLFPFLQIPAP